MQRARFPSRDRRSTGWPAGAESDLPRCGRHYRPGGQCRDFSLCRHLSLTYKTTPGKRVRGYVSPVVTFYHGASTRTASEGCGPKTASGLFLTAALHENYQYADNRDKGDQQPHPLPNRTHMLRRPTLRRYIGSLGKFGRPGRNEAVFPALNTSSRNPELQTEGIDGFPFEQPKHGIGFFTAGDPRVPMIVPRCSMT